MYNSRMSSVSVSEARASLPQLLDRVIGGEEVIITRHGQPVAVVVRPDALRVRRAEQVLAAAAEIGDLLEQGRRAPLAPATLSPERAEELISEVRAGRSRR